MPLPFSLARPLPRSPLRSSDGHRHRDAIVPRYLHISPSPIGNRYSVASLLSTPLSSTSASSRRSRGSIRKHLAVPYRRSLFRPRFARPYGSKRSNQGAGYAVAPFFGSLPALLHAKNAPFRMRFCFTSPLSFYRLRSCRPFALQGCRFAVRFAIRLRSAAF